MSYQKQNFADGDVLIAAQLNHMEDGIAAAVESNANTSHTLPVATTTTLGGVKVGDNLSIDASGRLSGAAPYTLPTATAYRLGGVKVGDGLSVYSDGTLSVTSVNGFSIKAQTTDPGTGSALSAGTILLVYK